MPIWATIRDVAARAGVSVGTASKAFNNKGALSVETREKVLRAATDLHFTPNALVRSLQRGQTHTIGAFTWPVRGSAMQDITMAILKGVSEGVASTYRDLLLYSHPPIEFSYPLPTGHQPVTAATFLDGRVDGLILGPSVVNDEALEMLANSQLPVIVLYKHDIPLRMGSVTIDNTSGVFSLIEHLVGLGHKRIAYSSPLNTPDFRERFDAYSDALSTFGMAVDPELLFVHNQQRFNEQDAADWFLCRKFAPTALVAGDDSLAFMWMNVLDSIGKRVPCDISVVGFDDCPSAANSPGLTTVRQPAEEVGRTAALFVNKLIGGADPNECRIKLTTELIIRGSTGPVTKG